MTAAREDVSEAALARVRSICLGFPAAEEKLSYGAPSFHVRGTMFLSFVDNLHGDGRLAVVCKATLEEQRKLVAQDPARFFVPAYVGVKGWVGVRLDVPTSDWIELAILVEQGWTSVAPKSVRDGKWQPKGPPPPPPVRVRTDAKLAREVLAQLTKICLALPEAICERESSHATYRVRKKVFAYFLDNHHGDGIVGACLKMDKKQGASLVRSDPKRHYSPAYIGSRGWVGVRLDVGKVDWRVVARQVAASYASAAPKGLASVVMAGMAQPASAGAKRAPKKRPAPARR
jgi:hypothetical protein